MTPITIETASLMCDVTTRTIRRWMEEGKILKLFEDDRGRSMISLDDVMPLARLHLTDDEKGLFEEADAGSAEAMQLIGAIFFDLKRLAIARRWLEAATKQGNADAMQLLGRSYLQGEGQNEDLAIMWIAKAASLGHVIAKQQMRNLRTVWTR